MAGSVNKVILVGNLGRDVEVRHSQSGAKIVTLSLATSESWKDKQSGERKEKTEWHRVVIFNDHLSNIAEQYLKKGSKVYLEGALQTRKWTGNDGVEKYTTEVVLQRYRGDLTMLDTRSGGGGGSHDNAGGGGDWSPPAQGDGDMGGGNGGQSDPSGPSGPSGGDLDDEIPF